MFRDAIVAADRSPDRRDPAQMRNGRLDQGDPARCAKERTGLEITEQRADGENDDFQKPIALLLKLNRQQFRAILKSANDGGSGAMRQPAERRQLIIFCFGRGHRRAA